MTTSKSASYSVRKAGKSLAIAAGILAAIFSAGVQAQSGSQSGQWCAYFSGGPTSCSYSSIADCLKVIRGKTGLCDQNPQYVPAPPPGPASGAGNTALREPRPSNRLWFVAHTSPPDAYLALRTAPSSRDGKRIENMPNGTLLKVLQRRGDGWWRVRVFQTGTEGWAFSGDGNQTWIECCQPAPST